LRLQGKWMKDELFYGKNRISYYGHRRLIRLPNLLIILLTQSLIRWSLIGPLLKANGMSLQMKPFIIRDADARNHAGNSRRLCHQ